MKSKFLVLLKLLSGKLVQYFVELLQPHGVGDLTGRNVQDLQQDSSILILLPLPVLPLLDTLLALHPVLLPHHSLALRPAVPGQKTLPN